MVGSFWAVHARQEMAQMQKRDFNTELGVKTGYICRCPNEYLDLKLFVLEKI